LRRALAERDAAQAELTRCSASLAACNAFVRQWDADVAKADEAMANHAKTNAAKIAQGEAPEIDESLSQIRSKAIAARADLIASRRHLEADEKAAAAALQRAQRKVATEVERVFTAHIVAEARTLSNLWSQVWPLFDLLSAAAEQRFPRESNAPMNPGDPFAAERGNSLALISLPPDVVRLVQELSGLDHRFATSKGRHTVRLDAWRKGLFENADCEL
jgi:hypothetical protein